MATSNRKCYRPHLILRTQTSLGSSKPTKILARGIRFPFFTYAGRLVSQSVAHGPARRRRGSGRFPPPRLRPIGARDSGQPGGLLHHRRRPAASGHNEAGGSVVSANLVVHQGVAPETDAGAAADAGSRTPHLRLWRAEIQLWHDPNRPELFGARRLAAVLDSRPRTQGQAARPRRARGGPQSAAG